MLKRAPNCDDEEVTTSGVPLMQSLSLPRRIGRRVLAASAVVTLAATAAACGTDPAGNTALAGSKVDPGAPVLVRALAATENAATGRVTFSIEVNGVAQLGTAPVKVDGSGEFDLGRKTSHLTVDPSALVAAATSAASKGAAGGSTNGGAANADAAKLLAGLVGPVEVVSDDQLVYVKSSVLSLLGGSTKPWVKFSVPEATGGSTGTAAVPTITPSRLLESLGQVSSDVTTVGPDTVRGTATTHYRATIQGSVLDVYVASDDTVRKIAVTVDLGKAAAAAAGRTATTAVPAAAVAGTLTLTAELYDLGTAITVAVPPAAQVADASTLSGLSGLDALGGLGDLGKLFGPR
jgi:hypothetical protein